MQNNNSTRFYCKNETKPKQSLWQENVPKIYVEQIKGKDKIYFYLYPLGT